MTLHLAERYHKVSKSMSVNCKTKEGQEESPFRVGQQSVSKNLQSPQRKIKAVEVKL